MTVPLGITEDLRNRPPHRHYNRCLHWHAGWDTRCAPSPDRQTAVNQTQVTGCFRTKIVDSALRHVPVGTTPESSVSVVASLDTCERVAHNRTHHYRSDLRVGKYSPTIVNKGMAIINRETLHRPGPHPHRSTFTSTKPLAIIIYQTNFIRLTTGYFNQSYSTTSDFMYGNMFVNCGSGSCATDSTPVTQTGRQNTSSRHDGIVPVMHPIDWSVNWSQAVDSPPEEEAVMQISGAGHWFLERWIGDHAVDFLVDSGSAVTTVSSSFYKNIREVGAPVGEIRATNRRLRGANGSRIDILGCSFCVVSFLGCRRSSPF